MPLPFRMDARTITRCNYEVSYHTRSNGISSLLGTCMPQRKTGGTLKGGAPSHCRRRLDRAVDYLKKRLASHPDEKILELLVEVLLKQGDAREASRILSEYVGSTRRPLLTYGSCWVIHDTWNARDEAAADWPFAESPQRGIQRNVDASNSWDASYEVNDCRTARAEPLYSGEFGPGDHHSVWARERVVPH